MDLVHLCEDFRVCGDGGRGEEEGARGHGGVVAAWKQTAILRGIRVDTEVAQARIGRGRDSWVC